MPKSGNKIYQPYKKSFFMTQPEIQLKRVHEKILLLLKQHQTLQKENERLKDDIRKMQERGELLSRDAEKFRHQAEVLKLSGRGLEEPDKKMLEKKLNQYVREIDKCIALLQE
jgi:archaellum component FlaC